MPTQHTRMAVDRVGSQVVECPFVHPAIVVGLGGSGKAGQDLLMVSHLARSLVQPRSRPVRLTLSAPPKRPRRTAVSSAVPHSVALIFPPDFNFVPPQTPETPAEPNPARAQASSRVTHLDVIDRLRLGNGCPGERALGPHPVFAAQQLVAIVSRPPFHQNVSRVSHLASHEAACPPCWETQERRSRPRPRLWRGFPGSLRPRIRSNEEDLM